MEREGITTWEKLSQVTEKEILKLHGMGPGSLPKLRAALKEADLTMAIWDVFKSKGWVTTDKKAAPKKRL